MDEDQIEVPADEETSAPYIFSPEGVLILFVAVMLDLLGIALILAPGAGWITTVLGAATIGVWSWIRLGSMSKKKRLKRYVKKFGVTGLLETLTAGLYPGWTIQVVSQLRKS